MALSLQRTVQLCWGRMKDLRSERTGLGGGVIEYLDIIGVIRPLCTNYNFSFSFVCDTVFISFFCFHVFLSFCESVCHTQMRRPQKNNSVQKDGQGALQRLENTAVFLLIFTHFSPPLSRSPTHSVPLRSVWMQSPVGFLVFCFYLCRACYGVSMETGSGSCAGTGHERGGGGEGYEKELGGGWRRDPGV